MALTLDATLAAAMDSQSRHPLVEILSKEWVDSIPFDGSYLSTGTTNELAPSAITHSTGRLCAAYCYAGNIRYQYSDTARTFFTKVDISVSAEAVDLCLCELANGNIGIIYRSTGALKYRIITVTGTAVSNGTIETISSTYITGPYVIRLADDSYLMVYGKKITGDSHYHLYKYTSSNFTSWTGPTELSISGLTDTPRKGNPSLLQITTGQIWLWFDYCESTGPNDEELTNIYYSTSDDNGATWGAADKITAYTTYATTGSHPAAVQKSANTMHLIYTEKSGALYMDKNTDGWGPSPDSWLSGVGTLHFDSVNRKLYAVPTSNYIAADYISGVLKIDVDTWAIEKYWDASSVPALLSNYFDSMVCAGIYHGEGQYVVLSLSGMLIVSVIDGENNTIRNFIFKSDVPYGYTQNVSWTDYGSMMTYGDVAGVWFDESAMRVYIFLKNGKRVLIGYIDYGAVAETYTFNQVFTYDYPSERESLSGVSFQVYPEDDLIMLISTAGAGGGYFYGSTCLFTISTGGLWKRYVYDDFAGYPRGGISCALYCDGKIYGGITHLSTYGQNEFRGMCVIDTASDTFTYKRPDWASVDDYHLASFISMSDSELLIASDYYGITIYNITNDIWELFDNTSLTGMTPSGENKFHHVLFDDLNNMIMAAHGYEVHTTWSGIIMFSRYGYLKQSQYITGAYDTDWTWTDQGNLVTGYVDYNASCCLDPDDQSIYAFWESLDATEYSIKWDKEDADFSLDPYLCRGEAITLKRTIDGNPASLSFSVSHGHLFDPSNNVSLISPYLKKGRKLTLRFGEKISGVDYWNNMGAFIVTEQSISYKRGDYPVMQIAAKDRMTLWSELTIAVSEYYSDAYPDVVIASLIEDNTDLESTDIDIDSFDNQTKLYHQWIDTTLMTAIQDILDRYGYYIRMDVDNKVTCKKISSGNTIDHTYTDTTKLINYTPDDRYSDFINKITVTGTELTEIEVLYAEERVGTISGTCGFWGGKKEHQVFYSDDSSRKCRYPRLNVLETATSIAFELAGKVNEELEDTSEYYCTIIVDCPDLTPILIVALAGVVASAFAPDWATVVVTGTVGHGPTNRVGSAVTAFFIFATLQILGAVGSYQYEVWACPVGTVKRSVSGTWSDTPAQAETGCVISKTFDDPLCYSAGDCLEVAEIEGLVTQLQRKRVKFEKIADLRDEDGDTVSIIHPQTGQAIPVFITDLERTMIVPGSDDEKGEFTDRIEGWRI